MTLDLGFAEKCEAWRLRSRFFPSKIGGRPAWLDLKDLPSKSDLECEYCSDPCVFLCQIYAPYEEDVDAFHRTVFVFICKNVECCRPNQNGNLKVFRSQLNRINTFYPSEPPLDKEDRRKDIDASQWVKTCRVCGILALSHCAKCKVVDYCSRTHQVYDWKNGHKDTCGVGKSNSESFLFPEYEIVINRDDLAKESIQRDHLEIEQKEIEKYNAMIQRGQVGTLQDQDIDDDLSQMANDENDKVFAKFCTKINHYPAQILRYDRGGEILYISPHSRITDVPRCPECNNDRQFEFQIMPQLLNFLDSKDIECLDWGILAVFTCKQSCTPNGKYVREYIWKQDIVQEMAETKINHDI